jgi:hypothetical protein
VLTAERAFENTHDANTTRRRSMTGRPEMASTVAV